MDLRRAPPHVDDLAAQKDALAGHPIYEAIDSLPRLRLFVEHHVACVWDFMSLLKSLQRDLAPVRVPWQPPADPEAARLVNEIVLDEESDALPYRPGHASHFEWYVEAMDELGANTRPVHMLLLLLARSVPPVDAMRMAGMPEAACQFTSTTFSFVDQPLPVRAAVFLHGREEAIPRMFLPLVHSLRDQGLPCTRLLAYLERHIDLDGGAHQRHAASLLTRLCAAAPELQRRCETAASAALAARRRLWDAIMKAI